MIKQESANQLNETRRHCRVFVSDEDQKFQTMSERDTESEGEGEEEGEGEGEEEGKGE